MAKPANKEELLKAAREGYEKLMKMIEMHTDAELFEKKHYAWTGTTSLGAYCISATSSHYEWARKKIGRYGKELARG